MHVSTERRALNRGTIERRLGNVKDPLGVLIIISSNISPSSRSAPQGEATKLCSHCGSGWALAFLGGLQHHYPVTRSAGGSGSWICSDRSDQTGSGEIRNVANVLSNCG